MAKNLTNNSNSHEDHLEKEQIADELKLLPNFETLSPHVKTIIRETHQNKNIRVIAGAGSGKTETLSLRVLNILLTGQGKPENIVAFTFTQKAAESLKSRIYLRIQDSGRTELLHNLNKMYIGTIHSYCLQLLQDHYDLGNYLLLNDITEKVYIQKYGKKLNLDLQTDEFLKRFGIKFFEKKVKLPKKYAKRCSEFINSYNIIYNEELEFSDLEKYIPNFIKEVRKFEQFLSDDQLLTFGQLINRATASIEKDTDPISDLKFLFVDEYQDINPAQEHLIKLLGTNAQVFVVGDPKQSIYNWRGSRLESFIEFNKLNPKKEVRTRKIPQNWRSLPTIVEFANKFADKTGINVPPIRSDSQRRGADGFIKNFQFPTSDRETKYIINQIVDLVQVKKKLRYSDFAILCRSVKKTGKSLIDACIKNKIPYSVGGKVGLFRRKEIKCVLYLMISLYEKGFWNESKDRHIEKRTLVTEGFQNWDRAAIECGFQRPNYRDFVEKIQKWKIKTLDEIKKMREYQEENPASELVSTEIGSDPDIYDRANPEEISEKKEKLPKYMLKYQQYLSGKTYVDIYYELLEILDVKSLDLQNPMQQMVMANLGRFSEILNEFEFTHKIGGTSVDLENYFYDLNQFLYHYQNLFEETQVFDERNTDTVKIYTIHQAKGLEWPVVFIPSVIEKTFPTSKLNSAPENFLTIQNTPGRPEGLYPINRYTTHIKDEARLFYVACTRGKNAVIISSYQTNLWGSYTKDSEFMADIEDILSKREQPIQNIAEFDDFPPDKEFETKNSHEEFDEYSITEILDYKKCPRLYQFRHLWKFGARLNRFLGYGHAIHHILRRIVEIDAIDLSNQIELRKELHKLIKTDFNLPYLSDPVNAKIQEGAEKMIFDYVSKFGTQLNNMKSVETRLELINEQAILKGIADIIMEDAEDNSGIHIRDYKTKTMGLDAIHQFQIELYSGALENMGFEVKSGSIGFLKEMKNKKIELTAECLKYAKKNASEIVNRINRYDFNRNDDCTECNPNCDYYSLCKKDNKSKIEKTENMEKNEDSENKQKKK